MNSKKTRDQWSSSFTLILACVGSAVGLGNIWKFPYITHQNGGGAFVLVYLTAIVLIGMPIMIAEIMIGRHYKLSAFGAIKKACKDTLLGKIIGTVIVSASFIILSYYSVVAGWTLDYFISSLTGQLKGLNAIGLESRFGEFVGNGIKQVSLHTIIMFLTGLIVLKGTKRIEKVLKFLMPLLFLLIIFITSVSFFNFGATETFNFLFSFDLSTLTGHSILEATGHAFFTLSLGFGAMLVYGSYMNKNNSIKKTVVWIVILDTLIALLACFMMYPIIFGANIEVKESISILFTTISLQLNQLPGGSYISAFFYLLVATAALSSTISLLEPVVAFVRENLKLTRKKATYVATITIWIFGIFSALSNGASQFLTDLKVLDQLDYFASNWMITIGGIAIAIIAGLTIPKATIQKELGKKTRKIWMLFTLIISPITVLIIIAFKIGILS